MKRNMLWAGLAALLLLSATSFGQDIPEVQDIGRGTQGEFEMLIGVTPTKVNQVNMDTARQMITGVNNRFAQLRMERQAPAARRPRRTTAAKSDVQGAKAELAKTDTEKKVVSEPVKTDDSYCDPCQEFNKISLDANPSFILNDLTANRVWAGVLGQWEKAKNLGTPRKIDNKQYDITGYKYNSWGLMLGYDRQFGPVTVGASFGFSKGNYKDLAMDSNNSKIENYSLNVYGLYTHTSGFWASGMFGWTHARNKMDYRTDGAHFREKFKTNSLYIEGKVGYDWRVKQFRLSPSIGLGYIRSRSTAHSVELRDAVEGSFRYNKQTGKTGYLPIMLEAAYDAQLSNGVLSVSVNGGYTYNFNKKGAVGTITGREANTNDIITYSSFAREKGRSIWNIGAGLKYDTGKWEGGVKYDYYSKKKAHANRIYGWVGIKF